MSVRRLNPQQVRQFRALVYRAYARYRRDFAWRKTRDPYRILVSEVMLQQTQAPRVVSYYERFLKKYPTVRSLAMSRVSDLLIMWQGLGYNRRALNLRRAAQAVVTHHRGAMPRTYDALLELPGIGPCTAAGILAFAYGTAAPYLETNVRTVLLHHFFADETGVSDRELLPLVEQTLDDKDPRRWYYAMLDYGVVLKKLHVNPSRRSAAHKKQSRFEGSHRQLRGQLLKNLGSARAKANELAVLVDRPLSDVRATLGELSREGFVRYRRGAYELADK